MPAPDGAVELVPEPDSGRVVSRSRLVRLGDITPSGRLRLDALARYLHDIGSDDADHVGLPEGYVWIVRRTLIEMRVPPVMHEQVELRTFCGGIGQRWAERRTSIRGDRGAEIETCTLWVCADVATRRPARVPERFHEVYGEASRGRRVRARLQLDDPPDDLVGEPWPLRVTDLDILDHVNNAVYWSPVEELLAGRGWRGRVRAEMEYRTGIERGAQVELLHRADHDELLVWLRADGLIQGSARVVPLG